MKLSVVLMAYALVLKFNFEFTYIYGVGRIVRLNIVGEIAHQFNSVTFFSDIFYVWELI